MKSRCGFDQVGWLWCHYQTQLEIRTSRLLWWQIGWTGHSAIVHNTDSAAQAKWVNGDSFSGVLILWLLFDYSLCFLALCFWDHHGHRGIADFLYFGYFLSVRIVKMPGSIFESFCQNRAWLRLEFYPGLWVHLALIGRLACGLLARGGVFCLVSSRIVGGCLHSAVFLLRFGWKSHYFHGSWKMVKPTIFSAETTRSAHFSQVVFGCSGPWGTSAKTALIQIASGYGIAAAAPKDHADHLSMACPRTRPIAVADHPPNIDLANEKPGGHLNNQTRFDFDFGQRPPLDSMSRTGFEMQNSEQRSSRRRTANMLSTSPDSWDPCLVCHFWPGSPFSLNLCRQVHCLRIFD